MSKLLIIDDDPVSLAVLTLQAGAGGHSVLQARSGEDALRMLDELPPGELPDALLVDLQMPGVAGEQLAVAIRILTGPTTLLLAMSASENGPGKAVPCGYDDFLRKPLDPASLEAALQRAPQPQPNRFTAQSDEVLHHETFAKLRATMRKTALLEIYGASVNDTRTRIAEMRACSEQGDFAGVRFAAHAIKGGAGMIGATQLSGLAARIELEEVNEKKLARLLDQLSEACNELERVIDGK